MRNLLLIARREYLEQVRGRAFRMDDDWIARGVRGDPGHCVPLKPGAGS